MWLQWAWEAWEAWEGRKECVAAPEPEIVPWVEGQDSGQRESGVNGGGKVSNFSPVTFIFHFSLLKMERCYCSRSWGGFPRSFLLDIIKPLLLLLLLLLLLFLLLLL